MRSSRAGRTGRSWYGSYEVLYREAGGAIHRYSMTNRRDSERAAREHVRDGAAVAEVSDDHGVLLHVCNGSCAACVDAREA